MATYRDAAIAAYEATRAEWVTAGQEQLRPLMTNDNGNQVLDPIGKTEVAHEDRDKGLLVLHTIDGSDLHFAVHPDDPDEPVTMVQPADPFGWTGYGDTGMPGPVVEDLDDVGRVLVELEVP